MAREAVYTNQIVTARERIMHVLRQVVGDGVEMPQFLDRSRYGGEFMHAQNFTLLAEWMEENFDVEPLKTDNSFIIEEMQAQFEEETFGTTEEDNSEEGNNEVETSEPVKSFEGGDPVSTDSEEAAESEAVEFVEPSEPFPSDEELENMNRDELHDLSERYRFTVTGTGAKGYISLDDYRNSARQYSQSRSGQVSDGSANG